MKPVRTWILLADGTQARLLVNEGPGKGVRQLNGTEHGLPEFEPVADYADRPGRVHESSTTTRHGVDARRAPGDASKQKFAQTLAHALASSADNFDRLVIAAAPATLGILRDALPDTVESRVHGTIAKDLVGTPTDKIPNFLGDVMVV